jgi:hypothetical protein
MSPNNTFHSGISDDEVLARLRALDKRYDGISFDELCNAGLYLPAQDPGEEHDVEAIAAAWQRCESLCNRMNATPPESLKDNASQEHPAP